MAKCINLCLLIILAIIGVSLSNKNMSKSRNLLNSRTTGFGGCWRYGTNSINDYISNIPIGNVFITNQSNQVKKAISYFADKNTCTKNCVSPNDNDTYSCYSANYGYDVSIGITNSKWYVCWIKSACPAESDASLFNNRDAALNYPVEAGCNFLCRTAYGSQGKCLLNNGNYECFWKSV